MNSFKKIFLVLFSITLFCTFANTINAQTRAYLYSHSVRDGVKFMDSYKNKIWYITFSPDQTKIYLTDENGVSRTGTPDGVYQGTENGIHVYKGGIAFLGPGYFYFSSDFSRLNWDCIADNFNNNGPKKIRVLNYVSNPKTATAPTQLY